MNVVDPSVKEKLWHQLQGDLATYIPEIVSAGLLMCCTCGRFLPFEKFNLEHIIPQQALLDDPPEIKSNPAATKNVRSGTTLLCNEPLRVSGTTVHRNGCNSWKGKFFDKAIREAFNGRMDGPAYKRPTDQHLIALLCMAYLAMVARFGYQIALIPSGLLMRQQFFRPHSFHKNMPPNCQMVLGAPAPQYRDEHLDLWLHPFKFEIGRSSCIVVCRTYGVRIPLSRDPRLPLFRHLPILPERYKLRPSFRTVFD